MTTIDGWVVAFKDTEAGQVWLIEESDDPPEGKNIERHVVPFRNEGQFMVFGNHDFTRECVCRPRIEMTEWRQAVVIHEDRKPN